MSYVSSFLKAYGEPCSILRNNLSINSYASVKPATQSYSDNRGVYREGLILADSVLTAGEVLTVGDETLLVRTVYKDRQSNELVFLASKVNAMFSQQRFTETTDEWGNVSRGWGVITDTVYSTAQIVSAALRQQDPGLLPTTKWLFLIPASTPIKEFDRVQFKPEGDKCQVDTIDNIRLSGLLRVQCSDDRR